MSSMPHPAPHPGGSPSESGVPAILAGLIDDAALFPPANAPMRQAVLAHRQYRASPLAGLVGRFLCSAGRVAELRSTLDAERDEGGADGAWRARHPADAGPLRLGVIADAGVDRSPHALADVAADPRLVLEAVEISLPPGTTGRHALTDATKRAVDALPTGLLGYVEVPRVNGWESVLDVLSTLGRGAKLRTGGPSADSVPPVEHVGRFLTACAARLLPMKCTAGLHHAVRTPDPKTGAIQHGFLNVLVAAAAAVAGEDPVPPLSEEDAGLLGAQVKALDPGPVRGLLTSFGSCSILEPVEDLRSLGLLS